MFMRLATLIGVSKAVHIISNTVCMQVDFTAFFVLFLDKLSFHLVVNCNRHLLYKKKKNSFKFSCSCHYHNLPPKNNPK